MEKEYILSKTWDLTIDTDVWVLPLAFAKGKRNFSIAIFCFIFTYQYRRILKNNKYESNQI